jgi:hypothetical protein
VDGKYSSEPAAVSPWREVPWRRANTISSARTRYQEYKATVKIGAGKTTTVSQSLQPRAGNSAVRRLRLTGFEKYAAVYE